MIRIGLTEESNKLYEELRLKKNEGYFDFKTTSLVRDDDEREIRIYCDSGRLYRPCISS